MGKKFLGLSGTDHFWNHAKAWILNQITSTVTDKIAGKADTKHTHSASDITSGTLPIGRGGTGATTAKGAEYNLIGSVETIETTPADDRYIALRNLTVSDTNGSFRWTKCSSVWSWIQSKISSVLGLTATAYGGKASTAGTADYATNITAGAALTSSNTITTTNPTKIGAGQIKVHTVYNASGPVTYGNLINIGGSGGFQMFVEWSASQTAAGQDLIGRIFTRFWRDNQAAWTAWKEVAYNGANVTFGTGTFTGKITATAAGIRIPTSQPSSLANGDIWIS